MSKKTYSILKFRRGNTTFIQSTTGAEGELLVNLQTKQIYLQDGVTQGGYLVGGDLKATANTIYTQGVDATQNTQINYIGNLAQAAFDYANTITNSENAFIQSAFDQANNANVLAQAGYDQANTGTILAQAGYDQANTSISLSQNAYNQANTNANDIIIIQSVNDTQNTDISNVNNLAQSAFDAANAIVIPSLGNYTFDGDTITNNVTDSITLQTGGDSWTFGIDGSFSLPKGGIIKEVPINALTITITPNTNEFSTTGVAQSPAGQWGDNITYPTGTPCRLTLVGATGDWIQYNGVILYIENNDGNNIRLSTNSDVALGQYINITTGSFDSGTLTLLNVTINSIAIKSGSNEWTFGTDGELTLPSGGHIGATKGGTMLDAGNGYDTSLTTFYANGNYAACVTGYAADGRLIITTYKDGGTDPSKQWTFDTDGNLTIPGGAKVGNIFNDGYGFGWQSPPDGGYAAITSNNISNYLAVDDDLLYTQVGDNRWSFESNGALTVPGDIIPNANNEYSLGSPDFQWKSLYVSNNTIYIENIPLSLKSNGNTNIITIGSGANTTNIASETYVQSFQNIDGGSSTAIYSYELINIDGGGA